MAKPIDMVGQKYNKWTVESLAYVKKYDKYYNCVCDCGVKKIVLGQNIRNGKSKSCGCERHKSPVNFRDRTGEKYGKLTCIRQEKRGQYIYWLCRCDCGNETWVRGINLTSGAVKSCGCAKNHVNRVHGLSHTRIHGIWSRMHWRCEDPKCKVYKNYGGRGISVCDEWSGTDGFIAFNSWAMKNGYADDLTIDRIDVNGNYDPDNCRWVTMLIQANNKRDNRIITYNGESHTMAEWSRIKGIPYSVLNQRINKLKWNVKDALTREVRKVGVKR